MTTESELEEFQSRAGFSECLDIVILDEGSTHFEFQSRAGFSECLDRQVKPTRVSPTGFNPVLGFLSVSTSSTASSIAVTASFQSRAGFSECLDRA